jgi:cytochrome c553
VNRILKWASIVVVVILVIAALAALSASLLSDRKLDRVINVEVAPVAFTNDPAAIGQGKYLFNSRGCGECHGYDGKGKAFIDDPHGLYAKSPNITPGPGGVVAGYTERDWVRTIRHGIKPSGRPLLIMPSEDYARFSDADLAALVAYVRGLPPAAGEAAQFRLPLIVKALYALGAIPDAAEKIDHSLPPAKPVVAAVNLEYGAYVDNACVGCHGPHLSGGKVPGGPPDWPPAANLTPGDGTAMARYPAGDVFKAMMRTGKRPDGSEVSKAMPFEMLKNLTDNDIDALHLFLKSLPPMAAGNR